MNPNLNTLRLAIQQCLSSPDVTSEQITDVIRETIKSKMDEATATTNKSRTILEKLRMPHHYSTCPDYLSPHLKGGDETITFSADTVAAQPVELGFDGLVGAFGNDVITFEGSPTSLG